MTEKLYYSDSFLREFDAVVTGCEPAKKGWKITLDRTAFYPEGGGQPTDKGVLTYGDTVVNISEVHEKNGLLAHTADAEIPIGTKVHGEIDWDRRFDLMQQHTGDHMISGVILSEYGYNNVGFHLTEKELVIDYDGVLTPSDTEHVIDVCNRRIWENNPISARYPQNVKEMDYRSKRDIDGDIRIVTVENVDVCACCGTHLKSTAQVGSIIIYAQQSFNGGTRLFCACGGRALAMLKKRNADCYRISHLLSSPVDNVADAVVKKIKENESLKMSRSSLKRSMIEIWVERTKTDGELAVCVQPGLDAADLAQMSVMLGEKKASTAIAVSDGKICIVSQSVDTNRLGRFIASHTGGKGGGKPGIYQGIVNSAPTAEQLTELYNEFKEDTQK